MTGREKIVENTFRLVEETTGVRVCYWPLGLPRSGGSSFRMENPDHSSHTCPYCTLVKNACNTGWCLRSKAFGIEKAAHSEGGFDGLCYMGVHDLVFPIRMDGQLLGILYLTGFRREDEEERAKRLILRGCRRMNTDAEQMWAAYWELPCLTAAQMEALRSSARYLREILLTVLQTAKPPRNETVNREESKKRWLTESVIPYVDANYRSELALTRLADIFYVNPQYLCRAFKAQTGMNFKQYIASLRVEDAQKQLRSTDRTIAEISRLVGWTDSNYFSRIFRELTGMTPSRYRTESRSPQQKQRPE